MKLKPKDLMNKIIQKEEEIRNQHYNIIMKDCLDFKSIDEMNKKTFFILELKKKTEMLCRMEDRYDTEIRKIFKYLEEL